MRTVFFVLIAIVCVRCTEFEEKLGPGSYVELTYPLTAIETELPVVNILVDQDEFNDLYTRVDEDIEIDGMFYLYRDRQLVVEEEVEVELRGSYSLRFDLKSLGVKFEDTYDNRARALINPPQLLPIHGLDEIESIRLRNSGNDFKHTMLKDLSYAQLAIQAGLDLDVTYGEPSLVFVNDAFYGLLNIRTEANARGMAGLYGAKRSEITLAKMEGGVVVKKDGDFDRIDALVQAVRDEDIDYLYANIDVDNFIDYMIFESYIVNEDWPANNARFFAINNGKFRFILFDVDVANLSLIQRPPLTFIDRTGGGFVSDLFHVLYEEEGFRQQFWDRYQSVVERGLFSSDRFKSIVLTNFEQIKRAMPLQIEKYQVPKTMVEWYVEVDRLSFLFEQREEVVINSLEIVS